MDKTFQDIHIKTLQFEDCIIRCVEVLSLDTYGNFFRINFKVMENGQSMEHTIYVPKMHGCWLVID